MKYYTEIIMMIGNNKLLTNGAGNLAFFFVFSPNKKSEKIFYFVKIK